MERVAYVVPVQMRDEYVLHMLAREARAFDELMLRRLSAVKQKKSSICIKGGNIHPVRRSSHAHACLPA